MEAVNAARWVALVAAFVMGAVAEWKLGVAVGLDVYTAALLPLTLDVYGFAAFKTGYRLHVTAAVTAMFAAQAVSHLLTLGDAPAHMVALSVLVSGIAPGVSLACHRIGDRLAAAKSAEVTAETPAEVTPVDDVVSTVWGNTMVEVTSPVSDRVYVAETPAESVTVPVDAPAESEATEAAEVGDVEETDAPAGDRKMWLAARGAELIAQGLSKAAAARELGVSRQWLHTCMRDAGLA